jgi:hypothetical protein
MATQVAPRGPLVGEQRTQEVPKTSNGQPVVWWACLGAAMMIFMAVVIGRWVTGPYFKSVEHGPSKLPDGQHAALVVIQVGGCALALFCIYWALIRPWLKERRVASEGLLVVAYGTLYFQDPISNASNYWFLYNTHLWNRGSWINDLPLINGYTGTPGKMWSEPIFGMGPGYVYFWVIGVWAGNLAFKAVLRKFPKVGLPGAIVACYFSIVLFDVILEAFIWMRSGFFVYPGARWLTLFGDSYLAYPFIEGAMIGMLLVPFVLMRHFRDDKGYTFAERGVDKLNVGSKTKVGLRFLALVAVSQCFFFFAYNIWAYQVGAHSTTYQKEVLERSQFLNGLCGGDSGRACPGGAVPNARRHSAYLGTDGKVHVPKGTTVPKAVPIKVEP